MTKAIEAVIKKPTETFAETNDPIKRGNILTKTTLPADVPAEGNIKIGEVPALFVKTDVVTPEATNLTNIPMLDWVYFDGNYFSLQPGETQHVRMTLAAKAPKQTSVRVEAWNVDTAQMIAVTH